MGAGTDLRIRDYLAKVSRSEALTRQPDATLQQEEKQASVFAQNQRGCGNLRPEASEADEPLTQTRTFA